ncbi:BZ3500_MvSof-1268-A1-R1_Chr5-3g08275 [Microbotryum saponariae]|uniref:BZ3500_MvSof-1268-A1-R1_Chr5-3g08275 protein n=1 Tax=Microbotryum saponariae TaxID=289078 RepID=A0A2X0KEW6_9BASI|nr:BZ3500_MvSof-1268-A1-R1_Chr5-3g08275 [Microbotryum saponariae]SDA08383.1 BZ3501_MvSof-1269-A2-R1_Chr5-3g08003 [Microbotryum saponariae]
MAAATLDHQDDDTPMLDVPHPALDKGKSKASASASASSGLDALAMDVMPWVEKYRPVTLDDVVAHKDIISTIDQFIAKSRVPHLLFYGPPGTGKTSTILAVARKIYDGNEASMRNNCLELNASDDRGIDVVREQIKNFASTRMSNAGTRDSAGFKLIILDEADQMTSAAQSALRRVIEQYTKNVRFCIICNYVNKIIPAVQSRCTRFRYQSFGHFIVRPRQAMLNIVWYSCRFGPLPRPEVEKRLNHVVDAEKYVSSMARTESWGADAVFLCGYFLRVNLTEDGRQALLKLSKGDMRRSLNVLQACHAAYDVTDEAAVYNCTGNPDPADIEAIMQSMMNESFETSYRRISSLKMDKGLALQDIIQGCFDFVATVEFPRQTRVVLLDHLAQVEHRLSTGASEKLQLTALLGATKLAIELSQNK